MDDRKAGVPRAAIAARKADYSCEGYVTSVEARNYRLGDDLPWSALVTVGDGDMRFETDSPAKWPVGTRVRVTVERAVTR